MSLFYTNAFVRGSKIFVRGYNNGIKFYSPIKFSPTLYVPLKGEDEGWRSFIEDTKISPIEFDTIREAKDFVMQYENVSGFPIYGQTNYVSQYISTRWTYDVPYDERIIDAMFIDIETATEGGFPNVKTANEEVLLITVKRKGKKPITFSSRPVEGKPLNCEFNLCHDEKSLLRSFINHFSANYPDVITGWNIESFDVPYLCNRIMNILGEEYLNKLSPFGFVYNSEVEVMNRIEMRYELKGIAQLDYLALYRKFVLEPRESYKLDFIAEVELGRKKLDHSEYETFKDFYTNDWRKFVEYNIIDVELVEGIDDKRQLLSLVYGVAYMAKVNFEDVFSPIKTWESYIYNALYAKKRLSKVGSIRNARESFGGGHVKDTIAGFYEWVVTFDLTSLYPHLIMLANISPECIVDDTFPANLDLMVNKKQDLSSLYDRDLAMAGNGQLFRRDTIGIFPELMKELFNVRNESKDKMKELKKSGGSQTLIATYNTKQNAIKVLLNSLFGAAGNPYFKYYDLRMAEGITMTGQLAIRWIERKMNEYMNKILDSDNVDYVAASDTDSIMVNFGPFVKSVCPNKDTLQTVDFLDKVCSEQFGKYIHKSFGELADYINAKEHSLHMKRENICDRGIFLKKKRYILNVWDSEGVRFETPEPKVMGIELVKSSTPSVVRTELRDSIPVIMYKTESDIRNYVKAAKTKFFAESLENIAFSRGVSDIDKWYSSSSLYILKTPIHVRASILYNHLIKELKLQNKYPLIKNGDKIKFVYLKMPNTLKEDVIGFPSTLPPEFNLHKYIDYETQFSKAFMKALEAMVLPRGWDLTPKASMTKWGI